jgi:hypothetical protein
MVGDDRPQAAKPSVCWFEPLQLIRTGRQVALATIFGRYGRPHAIEAVTSPEVLGRPAIPTVHAAPPDEAPWHDYADQAVPFWFDYLADTGDGWDATATVAYHLSRPTLDPKLPVTGENVPTRRGNLLVFGGDTVYPTPSLQTYEERLVLPFRSVFPAQDQENDPKPAGADQRGTPAHKPDVYAIPGNHDWYDGLVSFTRLFCSKQDFAGWRAPQRRSYFALRLPGKWWLIGTDLQLGSEIDAEQEKFFRELAAEMADDDRIIVCHPEPYWVYETLAPNPFAYRSVHRLEQSFGNRIWVHISGDLHHYLRHESPDGRQRIIAGGGGAFLHLTARPDTDVLRTASEADAKQGGTSGLFRRCAIYPSTRMSSWLALSGPLRFHIRNPSFGFATALAYAAIGQALVSPGLRPTNPVGLWEEVVTRLFSDPFSLLLVSTTVLGIVLFTDTRSRTYRWIAGSVHALCHVGAAAAVAHASATLAVASLHGSLWRFPAVSFGTALGGYLVGPLITSVYLTASLLLFGRHREEASSALRCPDFKNFLRFRIEAAGDLTIYPVGIDRVARRWQRPKGKSSAGPLRVEPVGGTAPHLIEEPLHVPAQRPQ